MQVKKKKYRRNQETSKWVTSLDLGLQNTNSYDMEEICQVLKNYAINQRKRQMEANTISEYS